jgi:hypothetical protein
MPSGKGQAARARAVLYYAVLSPSSPHPIPVPAGTETKQPHWGEDEMEEIKRTEHQGDHMSHISSLTVTGARWLPQEHQPSRGQRSAERA